MNSDAKLSNGRNLTESLWMTLSRLDCAILASAYELVQTDVDADSKGLQQWQGSEPELVGWLEQRHGWTRASEYAQYYVAALRTALHASP